MKKITTLLTLCAGIQVGAQNSNDEFYMEDTLSLYLEGIISTHRNERDLCAKFSGTEITKLQGYPEIYFTLQDPVTGYSVIMFTEFIHGKWVEPVPVSFSGTYNDLEPFITPDCEWMYFASDRPLSDGTKPGYDIWRVKREKQKWGTPENLGSSINTAANEFYPSVNSKGDIYFTAERAGGVGTEDIYVCRKTATGFENAIPLDTGVNSRLYEFNAWIAPDDSLIIFSSYGRKDDLGRGDLYMSKKAKDGKWMAAVHFSAGINSNRLDYCPYVDGNGNFYFTSQRIIKNDYRPKINSVKEWDNLMNVPGSGNSDIYRVPYYHFREQKRILLGEEE